MHDVFIKLVHESHLWIVHPFWQRCSVNSCGVVLLRHWLIFDKLSLRRSLVFLVIGVVPSFVKVRRTKAAATLTAWHRVHVRPEWVVLLRGMGDALQQTSHKHMRDKQHMGPHPTVVCALRTVDLFLL